MPQVSGKGCWAWGGVGGWFCPCLCLCLVLYLLCLTQPIFRYLLFLEVQLFFEQKNPACPDFTGPAVLGLCHILPTLKLLEKHKPGQSVIQWTSLSLAQVLPYFIMSSVRVSPESREESFIVNKNTALQKLLRGKFTNISSTDDKTCPGPLTEKTIYSQEIKLLNDDILIYITCIMSNRLLFCLWSRNNGLFYLSF